MSNLIRFEFEGHALRVEGTAEEPLFNANDLCDVLGYANARDALAKHVDEGDVAKRDTPTASGVQPMNYVNEPGMYALVMRANTEAAKRVQRWVTHEVLPTLRKTGRYETPRAAPSIAARADAMLINARTRLHREMMRSIDEIHASTPLAPEAVSAAKACIVEATFGKALPGLKPATSVDWYTPTQIAERLGVSAARVGLTITTLGIRGNHEGVARAVLDKASHSHKTITVYQYTERAIAMIAGKLAPVTEEQPS